jgi:uncharacterized protein YjiS (DUF1127 family)
MTNMHSEIYRSTAHLEPRGLLRRLLDGAARRAAERRAVAQLRRLDDRLLRDVGLTRADVTAVVNGCC